ncbi:zinc ribbon domain-containing protein, partial [bacterium]|nr:zinc ribbon domain-containing protein [bacterium]
VEAIHNPLVTREIYEKAQIELGLRRRIKNKPKKINNLLPLRGYMKCVRCGRNLTGSGSKSKTGKKHYYYHCNKRENCSERIRVNLAHEALKDYLNELKPNQGVTELFKVILKKKYEQNSNTKLSQLKSLGVKIAMLTRRKNALLDRNLDGIISNDEFKIKNIELDEQIHKLSKESSQLENYNIETMHFVNFGIHLIQNIGKFFEKSNTLTKTMLLSSIFNEKLVFEDNKYRTPTLNKGLELICRNIKALERVKNKNGRLSFDNIPLSTRGGT